MLNRLPSFVLNKPVLNPLRLASPDEIDRKIEMNGRVLKLFLDLSNEDLYLLVTPAQHATEDGRGI